MKRLLGNCTNVEFIFAPKSNYTLGQNLELLTRSLSKSKIPLCWKCHAYIRTLSKIQIRQQLHFNENHPINPFLATFNVVEHLQDKLAVVITYAIIAITSYLAAACSITSLSFLSFSLLKKIRQTKHTASHVISKP